LLQNKHTAIVIPLEQLACLVVKPVGVERSHRVSRSQRCRRHSMEETTVSCWQRRRRDLAQVEDPESTARRFLAIALAHGTRQLDQPEVFPEQTEHAHNDNGNERAQMGHNGHGLTPSPTKNRCSPSCHLERSERSPSVPQVPAACHAVVNPVNEVKPHNEGEMELADEPRRHR